jgi:hypothetical protein
MDEHQVSCETQQEWPQNCQMLQQAYGEDALKWSNIFKWA